MSVEGCGGPGNPEKAGDNLRVGAEFSIPNEPATPSGEQAPGTPEGGVENPMKYLQDYITKLLRQTMDELTPLITDACRRAAEIQSAELIKHADDREGQLAGHTAQINDIADSVGKLMKEAGLPPSTNGSGVDGPPNH